jgi:hypothetical protein
VFVFLRKTAAITQHNLQVVCTPVQLRRADVSVLFVPLQSKQTKQNLQFDIVDDDANSEVKTVTEALPTPSLSSQKPTDNAQTIEFSHYDKQTQTNRQWNKNVKSKVTSHLTFFFPFLFFFTASISTPCYTSVYTFVLTLYGH